MLQASILLSCFGSQALFGHRQQPDDMTVAQRSVAMLRVAFTLGHTIERGAFFVSIAPDPNP